MSPQGFPAKGMLATPALSCAKCKHCYSEQGKGPYCRRKDLHNGYDPVFGKPSISRLDCYTERGPSVAGGCGLAGKFWEAA